MFQIEFTSAPDHLTFLLNKCPRFSTQAEAEAALDFYIEEFSVSGVIYNCHRNEYLN